MFRSHHGNILLVTGLACFIMFLLMVVSVKSLLLVNIIPAIAIMVPTGLLIVSSACLVRILLLLLASIIFPQTPLDLDTTEAYGLRIDEPIAGRFIGEVGLGPTLNQTSVQITMSSCTKSDKEYCVKDVDA
ncbi:hypothetical protein Tco_0627570 [Tanacetum coccineum]|uniref:Uncharacterized protein n=1 Tax=Tanacetum coccineum TaxID=301880 RepID=A0ABQ4WMW9_9ASTR